MKLITRKNKNVNNKQKAEERFDVVIIGGGQTGIILAKQLVKKEFKILIVDKDDLGIKTSLNLKNFSKLIRRSINNKQDPKLLIESFPDRLKYLNKQQNEEIVQFLESNSFFKFIKGKIEEIDEYNLTIDGKIYGFKKLVFATGSYFENPSQSKFPNLKRDMYYNLSDITRVDKFYKNVAIYGTDPQAIELAYSFALLGSNVYVFDENVNIFNNFDDELESVLKTYLIPEKIKWCLESKIIDHKKVSDFETRIIYISQGQEKYVDVEKIFVTGNKVSETRNLKTKYDLELNNKGSMIINNNFKLKYNPNYYAVGDVNGIKMLPDYANAQAITLANILMGQSKTKFNLYNAGFTIDVEPQVCFYGMNKQDLDYQNIKFNEFIYDFNYELNSKLYSHKSKMKLYTNDKHEILGVFLYGDKIKELLSIFILAANNKIKFHKLNNLGLSFYSKAEFIREATLDYELEFVGISKKIKKITNKKEKKENK